MTISSEPYTLLLKVSALCKQNREVLLMTTGDDGMTDYKLRYTRDSSTQTNDPQRKEMLRASQEWKDRFNVYFPSEQTVRFAHQYPDRTAGTICFSSRWWLGAKFPRGVLKDCESERRVLMHNKVSVYLSIYASTTLLG